MKKILKITGIIIGAFLIICMIIGIVITSHPNDFEYSVNHETNTVTITGIAESKRYKAYIEIPRKIKGYLVTSISEYAFKGNENILGVELPETISYIGKGAFENCKNLESISGLEKCSGLNIIENNIFKGCYELQTIKLPDSITSIGNSSFELWYGLKELSIPNSVSYIGEKAFSNCQNIKKIKIPSGVTKIENETFIGCASIKSIILPQGITYIGIGAFDSCKKLDTLIIPATVQIIEYGAFIRCYSLSSIDVDPENPVYTSIDGVLYNKDITELIAYPFGKSDKVFTIPEGVTTVLETTFAFNNTLDTINIPSSVTTIGNFFLYLSSVRTINYGSTVANWNKINKLGGLDVGDDFQTIHCTDAQIAKDGTVTYK